MAESKPCANGCGKLVKNQGAHNRYCPKMLKSKSWGADIISKEKIAPSIGTHSPNISTHDTSKSFWQRHFGRKQQTKPIEVSDPMELIEGLKPYEILEKNPKSGIIGRIINKNKDFIQVVLVSELLESKEFWAEKKGINRITYKDRMYILPRDIRGNVFYWHVDKKESLIDTAKADNEDAESSLHESQVANIYYTLGRVSSQNEIWGNIKLILLICIFLVLLHFAGLGYDNIIQKDVNNNAKAIMDAITSMNNSIQR